MSEPELVDVVDVDNRLGEGVIWDARRGLAWWTDIEGRRLFRYDPVTSRTESRETPERLCCFAPVAGHDTLVAAFESGFAFFDPASGDVDWIAKIAADDPRTRLNDGRTDRQGRFWSGSMVEAVPREPATGVLYCLDHGLKVSEVLHGIAISNSLCWSPDGRYAYHADTPTRRIDRYAFDADLGRFGARSDFCHTDDGCYPDGSIVDADGFLWNAQWGGGKVVRYSPDGDVDLELPVPAKQPSCVAFGGEALDRLFVTTATVDLDDELARSDGNGALLVYRTGYRGLVESEFVHGA
jgi:L-arabinonolactonase